MGQRDRLRSTEKPKVVKIHDIICGIFFSFRNRTHRVHNHYVMYICMYMYMLCMYVTVSVRLRHAGRGKFVEGAWSEMGLEENIDAFDTKKHEDSRPGRPTALDRTKLHPDL